MKHVNMTRWAALVVCLLGLGAFQLASHGWWESGFDGQATAWGQENTTDDGDESAPVEGSAEETKESASSDDSAEKAAEANPDQAAEEKPSEDKPAEEKPAEEKPAEEKPAEEKPAEEKPAEEKPTEEKPAEEKPAEEKPAKEKPAEEKPAEEEPSEEKPSEDSASAAERFATAWSQWKTLLDDLRVLRSQYRAAAPADQPALREQWQTLVERGRELLGQLRQAGVEAYTASPNESRELAEFLVSVIKTDTQADRYDAAYSLAQALVQNNCAVEELANWAGVAAFATHDFETAQRLLTDAANRGVLRPEATPYLDQAAQYQQLWKEEQALRAKEAEADDLPRVKLTTSQGEIVVELFENEAPETVGNFIYLVETGFYDGLTFHRVLPGFMAQGGCPEGTGTGGPGYEIYCECHKENHRKHFRGSLSMAHAGRDTGGSQFFLTFLPTPSLNGKHTVFGRVIEGLDVLAKLQRRDPSAAGPLPEPDKIVKAEVLRKRDHDYQPNKVQ